MSVWWLPHYPGWWWWYQVPVALPEAEYSPERDPEVPMVTAHTREESVRQLGRAVNDNDDDRDHLPAPAPPTATRPASLTGASARMGLFASLASSRPSTATLIGSSPPLPQATEGEAEEAGRQAICRAWRERQEGGREGGPLKPCARQAGRPAGRRSSCCCCSERY